MQGFHAGKLVMVRFFMVRFLMLFGLLNFTSYNPGGLLNSNIFRYDSKYLQAMHKGPM